MAAVQRQSQILFDNQLAREILLDVVRAQARSTTQISADLRVPHVKIREALNDLEKEGFLEGQALAKVPTEATALYSATEKGVEAARALETMKISW